MALKVQNALMPCFICIFQFSVKARVCTNTARYNGHTYVYSAQEEK